MAKWLTVALLASSLWAQDCRPNISIEVKGSDYYALPIWDTTLTFIHPADEVFDIAPSLTFVLSQPQWEPPAYRGVWYCSWIQADGGTPPYSYSASGLPLGINLDSVSGQLTGVPMARGVYQKVSYTATDAAGASVTILRELRVCGVGEECNGFN